MISPNALKQWLDFYDANLAQPHSHAPGLFGGGGGVTDDGPGRLSWAQQMMMQQQQPTAGATSMPDNFAGLPKPPDNSQGYNRLAALMGRRF